MRPVHTRRTVAVVVVVGARWMLYPRACPSASTRRGRAVNIIWYYYYHHHHHHQYHSGHLVTVYLHRLVFIIIVILLSVIKIILHFFFFLTAHFRRQKIREIYANGIYRPFHWGFGCSAIWRSTDTHRSCRLKFEILRIRPRAYPAYQQDGSLWTTNTSCVRRVVNTANNIR